MQIGTYNSIFGRLGSTGTSGAGARRPTSTNTSVFGPAAQVSLGEDIPTVTGFRDYTKLGKSGLWQFNLADVIGAQSSGVPPQAVSPEQRKAEKKAVKQAFTHIDEGNYAAARELMTGLLSKNKTNAAAVHALGYADLSAGEYKDAEQSFLRAHAIDSTAGYDNDARNARILQKDDDSVLSMARGMTKTSAQRGEGIRLLIAVTERSPENSNAHIMLGDAMLDEGDGNNGLMQYSTAIDHAGSGQLGQIEDRLAELIDGAPGAAFVWQLMGKTQVRQGRFEQAVQTLTQAYQLSDSDFSFGRELARAYVGVARGSLKRGDITSGMSSLSRAKELDPTGWHTKQALAEGYVARAEQYVRRHDHDDAVADYRQAAEMLSKGGDADLRERAAHGAYALGLSLQRKRVAAGGEIDGELGALQAAYDLDSGNKTYKRKLADTRNELGDQLMAGGEYQAAAQSYKKAHLLFEHDKTYKTNAINAFVAYADDRLYNLNYDDAVDAYLQAFKIDTNDVDTKRKLADAYTARGFSYVDDEKYTKAVMDFKSALLLFPNDATYQANYDAYKGYDV